MNDAAKPKKIAISLLFSALVALLSACADYEFRVNERVVYTPLPLFSDFTVSDAALHNCLVQTIEDLNVVRVQDLTGLKCSHAGITSLEGLERFSAIEWLHLSHNNIADIGILSELTRLEALDLADNKVRNVDALAFLPRLSRVDLSGNPGLDCQRIDSLSASNGFSLKEPEHCR